MGRAGAGIAERTQSQPGRIRPAAQLLAYDRVAMGTRLAETAERMPLEDGEAGRTAFALALLENRRYQSARRACNAATQALNTLTSQVSVFAELTYVHTN